jgi:FkbM family methyltransferase
MRLVQSIGRLLPERLTAPVAERLLDGRTPAEPALERVIDELVKPGWTCADVGAHRGMVTALLAAAVGPTGRVFAFEAHPSTTRKLGRRVQDCAAEVIVENLAISDGSATTLQLYAGRFKRSAEWTVAPRTGGRPELSVPATSLDQYFAEGPDLNMVKIDVEGAEAQVLAGMTRILEEVRPILFIEFHDDVGWRGRSHLLTAGYELFDTANDRRLGPADQRVYHCLALPVRGGLAAQRDAD